MGVEFGNPSYGKVDIGLDTVSFKGQEEWVKNILNKKIKKDIKQLPNANILHSIRFSVTPNSGVSDLKLIFKDSYFSRGSWETKRNFKTSVESYLENNGYNTNIIRVKG
jgi:hypothetical protein